MTNNRASSNDPLHQETAAKLRELHELEFAQMHPDVQNILTAICGPEDPLTGQRVEEEGMKGQLTRIEHRQANTDQKVNDLHANGRLKLSAPLATVLAALTTGLFTMLIVLLRHAIGG